MEIRFSGQVTKKEFRQAQKIMYNRILMGTRVFFGAVLVIITIVLAVAAATGNISIQQFYLPILFVYVFFTFPWWFPLLLPSAYDKQGNIYQTPIRGVISETEVITQGINQKFSSTWKAFSGYHRSNNLILIYQGKAGFNVFTRDLFASETDWIQFAELLQVKLGEEK